MSIARVRSQPSAIGREAAATLGLVVALLVGAILFPWFPGADMVREGAKAPWTLTAPRSFSFDSAARTAEVRTEAANAIPDVLVLDPSIRDRQIAELDRNLAVIQQVRTDATLSDAGREAAIVGLPFKLSEPSAIALRNATPAAWDVITSEAHTALGRVLSGTLRVTDLPDARNRVADFLSPALERAQASAISELLAPLIVPTLVVDAGRTTALREDARRSQPPIHVSHARGDVLVTAGQTLTAADVELLQHSGLWPVGIRATDVVAAVGFAILLGASVGGYARVAQPPALRRGGRQIALIVLIVVPALVAKVALALVLPDVGRHFLAYAVPLAAAPVIGMVILDTGLALLLAMLVSSTAAFVAAALPLTQGDANGGLEVVRIWLAFGASSYAGVLVAAGATRLTRYLLASAAAAVAAFVALLVAWLIDANRGVHDPLWMAGATVASGVGIAAIVLLAFLALRRRFGIVTRVELMELTQLSQPLLRRLQDEAPGTFQHSILVGNLAERAAERIGADPLLVRIGAYYHDVGKLVAPPFFVENSGETNPHETLDPLQSTRVIVRHVTAGIDIAREAGLPPVVVDFIPQHHGTRLAAFFYRRAAAEDPGIDPELFRYPGPRPQSREAALVMLADATEATVRAGTDHSAERIREVVEAVIRERVEEGQFDECDISLRDLRVVADSFVALLNAVYHPRVEYPGPTERELASRRTVSLAERPTVARIPAAPPSEVGGAEIDEDTPSVPSDEE
jgi:putative nucleotidyltransferase with HDIG domain